MSVGEFMGFWSVEVTSISTMHLHLWRGSHVSLGWEWAEEEEWMVMGMTVRWAWVDAVGKVWLWRGEGDG